VERQLVSATHPAIRVAVTSGGTVSFYAADFAALRHPRQHLLKQQAGGGAAGASIA
jgi:hypothetical protein